MVSPKGQNFRDMTVLKMLYLIPYFWLCKFVNGPLDWHDLHPGPLNCCNSQMSRFMNKPAKWHVRPAKTRINMGIHPVWSESSLSAWRMFGSLATHWAHSEDSDLSLRWAHMPLRWFCHEAAQMKMKPNLSNFCFTSAPIIIAPLWKSGGYTGFALSFCHSVIP